MIGSNLLRYKTDQVYIGLDCETESLSLYASRPWQVAWTVCTQKSVHYTKVYHLAWPNLQVAREAAIVTRFNQEYHDSVARPPDVVLDEFESDLMNPEYRIIWQNGLFSDFYFHQTWRRALGRPYDNSYIIRSIDVKGLTQALKKGWQPDVSSPQAFLSWQYKATGHTERGLKSSLATCGPEEGIDHDYSSLHDARSDISLMMKVYWKRLFQLEF